MDRAGWKQLTLLVCLAAAAQLPGICAGSEPIPTRQSAFSVPFSIDTDEPSPQEIQLYVSPDKGSRWDLYDKAKPERGKFVFRAPRDGEYWFAIRSVDAAGKATPEGQHQPGLKVIVDTMPPRLDVTAERLPSGELSAQWQAVDPLLDPTTIKIEYRGGEDQEWRELAASQARISEGKNTLSGDGVWWLQEAPGAVVLRLQISDRAGNPTITQFKLKAPANLAQDSLQPVNTAPSMPSDTATAANDRGGLEEVAPPPADLPEPTARSFGVSVSAGPTAPSPRYWGGGSQSNPTTFPERPGTAQRDTEVARNPFARPRAMADGDAGATAAAQNSGATMATSPPSGTPWAPTGVASRPLGVGNRSEGDWRVGSSAADSRNPGAIDFARSGGATAPRPSADGFRPAGSGSSASVGSATSPGARMHTASLNGGRSVPTGIGNSAAVSFDYGDLSPAERPKMVNARTFEIDYEIESVGSSGIARVELFGTRDGGQSWISLGTDPDNRSPLVVTVNGEGLYGFYVVVESASGLSGQPPRPSQRPELWIGVDLSKPQVAITGVEPGNNPDELVVFWEAQDQRFGSRPISIFFSDRQGGPWTVAAGSLENTGSYVWRLDNRVREQIYLKVEARDAAGNVGWFETTEPIALNRQLPQGKIRGVRPVGGEPFDGGQAMRAKMIENHFAR